MALYFKDIEITKLRNLAPQSGLDITDIWFGTTNIYTVWQTYEGTLPATINANGDDMRQYQIYGNTGGVGDKTENLFDKNATDTDNGYDSGHYFSQSTGSVVANATYAISEYIPVLPSTVYTCVYTMYSTTWAPTVVYYDSTKAQIGYATHVAGTTFSFASPANCAFVRMSFLTSATICSLTHRTENLYDKNNVSMNFFGYINNTTYAVVSSSSDSFSIIVPVEPNTTYTIVKPATSRFRVGLFTSYPYVGEVATAIYDNRDGNGVDRGTSLIFTTSSNTSYILAFIRNYDDAGTTNDQIKNSTVVFEGATPETFVPFGYSVDMSTEKPIIYGFRINPNDPNSYTAVTYLKDAVGKTPAAMGSTAFSYGDWANAFFMPRPCMLKYDGTVDYYLNPNDYSQKADGTPSDYNNLAYGGNAMMEFPLIWYKFVQGAESGEGYFYCSNRKVDDSYKCFSNLDCDGNIIEHFYMPIYNGCTYDGKMRSISGLQLSQWSTTAYSSSSTYTVGSKVNYNGRMWECTTAVEAAEAFDPAKWEQFAFNGNTTGTEEITQATANNTTAKVEWYTDVLCDRQLINALLVLLSKSLNTQGSFGRGIDDGGQVAKEAYVTGSLDDKGLFYGSIANGSTAVKVFGIENWWSLVWHRTAGLIGGSNNTYLYKMTYSTSDGSTANGYNTDGTGYLSIGNKPTTNNYIKKMQYGLWGCLPIETGSYSTQFWNDYFYDGTGYARCGGYAAAGAAGGAFYAHLGGGAGYRHWSISSDLSCKPCRTGNLSKNLESATVTPIYIGNNPLQDGEFIDFLKQKIYRKSQNGIDLSGQTNKTSQGVLYTVNSLAGTITASRVSSGTEHSQYHIVIPANVYGNLYFKACPSGGGTSRYYVFMWDKTTKARTKKHNGTSNTDNDLGNGNYLETSIVEGHETVMIIQIAQGYNADNVVFTPYIGTVNADLTPTDPPVSLPALPTCDGETIVDYAGESVAPEKVAFKYRKKNF